MDMYGCQYIFDGFVLYPNRILAFNEKQTILPPKEFGVLSLLLQVSGEIVDKNELIDHVWGGGDVNEESLTRCICVLRRILFRNKNTHYIDTVYGKGYRFNRPVQLVPGPSIEKTKRFIAVLPPESTAIKLNTYDLHCMLVQELIKLTSIGIKTMPITLTQHCKCILDVIELSKNFTFDYYLATRIVFDDRWELFMEIFGSRDYNLITSKHVSISSESEISSGLGQLLVSCIDSFEFPCSGKKMTNSLIKQEVCFV